MYIVYCILYYVYCLEIFMAQLLNCLLSRIYLLTWDLCNMYVLVILYFIGSGPKQKQSYLREHAFFR